MALQLTEEYKGIEANYWKIIRSDSDVTSDTTRIVLALYKDITARNESVLNYLKSNTFRFPGVDMTRTELYSAIKEPVMEKQIKVDEEGQPMKDEDGEYIMEDINVNVFVDAVDV